MVIEGQQLCFDYRVTEADLASTLALQDGDEYPPVFATARMIGLMEVAAARLMGPLLQPGQLSVGVGVDVKHLAATPVGELVTLKATYSGCVGKLHQFEVELRDAGGVAGAGKHTRAIVDSERLRAGAASRVAKS